MTIIIFLIVLAILIVVHEYGHFIVAKRAGVRVDEFGLGFPPRILSHKPKNSETTYTLNLFPIGGFVKIFGEDPTEAGAKDGPEFSRSLLSRGPFTQIAMFGAGVVCNMLLAWVLFSTAFMAGFPTIAPSRFGDIQDVSIVIGEIREESPAALAGFMPGDTVLSLDEKTIETVEDMQTYIQHASAEPITLTFMRDGEEQTADVTPAYDESVDRHTIGVLLHEAGIVKLSFFESIAAGLVLTGDIIGAVALGLFDFVWGAVTGTADFSDVAGPVGLVGLVGEASALGFVHLITFTALISINLAIINLVPFPALDGGRILFVLIEMVKGSPIKPVVAQTLNTVGFVLLLLLIAVVTFQDILKLVGN